MSKHFILAQRPGGQTIKQMDLEHGGDSAVHRSVAYGGEIVVNLDYCTYTINNGSGTYRPDSHDIGLSESERPSHLKTMAQKFNATLRVAPTSVQTSVAEGEITPTPVPVNYGITVIEECAPLKGSASAP